MKRKRARDRSVKDRELRAQLEKQTHRNSSSARGCREEPMRRPSRHLVGLQADLGAAAAQALKPVAQATCSGSRVRVRGLLPRSHSAAATTSAEIEAGPLR